LGIRVNVLGVRIRLLGTQLVLGLGLGTDADVSDGDFLGVSWGFDVLHSPVQTCDGHYQQQTCDCR